jgi:hypothetical protein
MDVLMARPMRLYRNGGKPEFAKREMMKTLLISGISISDIAGIMGYANEKSARNMIYRWGFTELYPQSFLVRAREGRLVKVWRM